MNFQGFAQNALREIRVVSMQPDQTRDCKIVEFDRLMNRVGEFDPITKKTQENRSQPQH